MLDHTHFIITEKNYFGIANVIKAYFSSQRVTAEKIICKFSVSISASGSKPAFWVKESP